MRRPTLALALLCSSCGEQAADPPELGRATAAVTFAGAQRFVVWQHNISWFASALAAETAIVHAIADYPVAPDVFTFQECGTACICGQNGAYDAQTGHCGSVGGPGIERALRSIGHGDEYTFRRKGLRVIGFRDERFRQIGSDMHWGASLDGANDYFAACSTVEVGQQLSVMLEDLLAPAPMQVLVSTGHWFVGRDCACKQVRELETNWKTAPELRDSANADAESYVDLHIFSGDWNAQPSTALPTAYRDGGSCDGSALGGDAHEDTAGNAFTFCQGAGGVSTPDTCTNKQKVDYLWARKYNQSGISWDGSPDKTADYYNDHRAIRTVFVYPETPAGEGGEPVDGEGGAGAGAGGSEHAGGAGGLAPSDAVPPAEASGPSGCTSRPSSKSPALHDVGALALALGIGLARRRRVRRS